MDESDTTQLTSKINKLHAILKPFLLRRKKDDVDLDLPPKHEYVLFANMSEWQHAQYHSIINKDEPGVVSYSNPTIQLRKCANHPYMLSDWRMQLETTLWTM